MPHTGLRYRKIWLAAVVVATGTPLFGQTVSNWTTPDSGLWTDPTHWSTNPFYPNNGAPADATYDAQILAAGSSYTLGLSSNVALQSLTLNSTDATLLQTGGTLSAGTVSLLAGTYDAMGGGMQVSTLSGGAGINVTGNYLLNVSSLGTHVDVGAGALLTLAGSWSNSGTIAVNSGTLTWSSTPASVGSVTLNNSTLQIGAYATIAKVLAPVFSGNSAVRIVTGGGVDNTGNTISLTPSGPAWQLAGGTIGYGSITSTGGTKLSLSPGTSSTLTSVVLGADVDIPSATTLSLTRITNAATITVNTGGTLNLAAVNSTSGLGNIHNNGGTVQINGSLDNAGSTLALNASTGPWTLVGSRFNTIANGTITGTAPNNLVALGGTLTSVILDGDLSVGDGVTGGVSAVTSLLSLTPNSRILISAPAGVSTTSLLTSGVDSTFAAGELVFNGSGDGGSVRPETSGASLTFAPSFTARTGTRGGTVGAADSILVNNGTLSAQTAGRTLSVLGTFANAGTVEASNGGTLSIAGAFSNSGTAAIAGGSAMKVSGTIANTGKVDLAGGSLVLDYTGSSPAAWLRDQLATGRSGGSWAAMTGITSSTGAADPQQRLGIGYIEASDLGVTSWAGVGVDATSLLTKLTYYGDANLDGTVDAEDFALVDRGYAMHLGTWASGDFDYSGTVDAADYLLMDRVFIQQGNPLSPSLLAERESQFGPAYAAQLLAVIPEPSAAMLLMTALPLLSRRRRA